MNLFALIFSFVFGTLIGSFLNVVSLRYNTGMGVGGRSKCFSCGKTLTWKELIPLASFAMQKGSCKKCKSKISWQYPLVEFLSGILFVLVLFKFPPTGYVEAASTALYLFVTCLMLVITVYDMKHKIIPDPLVWTFDAVAVIAAIAFNWGHLASADFLWAILAGPICAAPFALIWVISKGKWMGLGDAKLILGIGWLLGLSAAASAITLAFWIGAVISVLWMYSSFGKLRGHYEIPFAPYLILGMYVVLLFNINVFAF
ncbi:MAG: prepilin peptidase leader peptidase (prepilin peptidase) / N-methyltransferase [Candidatus Taylorbacteria bacterium]|nr:prepilin peptidase leader peptidase (prepilin peptidase) / N-methyltransferase [Candidatus Taylorbacteria bacterium]